MPELIADLFVSLDGFAAGVHEAPFFGYAGHDLDRWIKQQLEQPQTIVMGRVTYELFAEMMSAAPDPSSRRLTELPKLVFSNTLTEPLSWHHARLVRGALVDEIRALKAGPGDVLRSMGSIRVVRTLVQHGLVDRLRLMVFPLVLGALGRERIFDDYTRTAFEFVNMQRLDGRLVLLEYRPTTRSGTESA